MNGHHPLLWVELHLPASLPTQVAMQAVRALASLPGQPRLVLETSGQQGRVRWFVGGEASNVRRAVKAVRPHIAELRTKEFSRSTPEAALVGLVRLPGHRSHLLDTRQTEAVARGILGALAGAGTNEVLTLQVVLGPRHRPRLVSTTAHERKHQAAKLAQLRLSSEIRIGAQAADSSRARRLVETVAAALRIVEAPGVALRLRPGSGRSFALAKTPWFWRLELGVEEIAALLGWPVSDKDVQLPGLPPRHPRLLAAGAAVPARGRLLGVSTAEPERQIALSVADSLRHLHILGPNGTGKSVLIAQLALQDMTNGRGVVVIDPKGDLVQDLLARIPRNRQADVIVLDPTDRAPAGIAVFSGDPEHSADVLLGVFRSLYGDGLGPRSSDVLHASLLTLARVQDASLSMLPLLLTNPALRRRLVAQVASRDPMGLGAFWAWFDGLSHAERGQVIMPLKNKLDPVLTLRPGLRAVFGQPRPKLVLPDVFTQRRILLVSLASGSLGPEAAALLGSVVVALLWQAALQRISLPPAQRQPVMIYVDEMQAVVRLADLGGALAMARSLGVGFTLAHQSLTQLPTSMRDAVLANARSRVAFQLSPKDARGIAATSGGVLTARDFLELRAYQAYASLLSAGSRAPWCSLSTRPLGPATADPAELRRLSSDNYGQPIESVEAPLVQAAGLQAAEDQEHFGRTARPGGEAGSP